MGRTISNPPRASKKRGFEWKSDNARKRSAEAGAANLAAYRAKVAGELKQGHTSHGVVTFLNKGGAPAEIAAKLDDFQDGLLSDLGEAPTTAERALIEATRTSLGVCLLAQRYLGQGSLSSLKKNRWLLQTLATFCNSTRLNLLALGLQRRAKEVLTLDDVVKDISARRVQSATGDANSPEVQSAESVAERMETRG